MTDILLIASTSIDRVWRLDAPLRPGSRLAWRSIEERFGGGGINTGGPLAALGHHVAVAGVVHDDDRGRSLLAELERFGIATGVMAVVPGETPITEILVEPDGERTLIFPPRSQAPRPAPHVLEAGIVYVNARRLPAETDAALAAHPLVVAQFPLNDAMAHPARILIGSRSDFPGGEPAALLARGRAMTGCEALVLTSGTDPVTVTAKTSSMVPVMPVSSADTTGAGDVFAAGLLDGLMRRLPLAEAARSGCELARGFLAKRRQFPL